MVSKLGNTAGFEPAQHGAADIGQTRHVSQGKILAFAQPPCGAPEVQSGILSGDGAGIPHPVRRVPAR